MNLVPLQIDHIRPREFGGSDKLKNLRLLCNKCHLDRTRKIRLRTAEIRRNRRYHKSMKRKNALRLDEIRIGQALKWLDKN